MLNDLQKKAIEKMITLADEALASRTEFIGAAHNKDFEMLQAVRSQAEFVLKYDGVEKHQSGVDGCLHNLRECVKRFGWKL